MLDPQDRKLLFDLLKPPTGYRLDAAIGTTYSLDLLALLVTPLAFTLFDYEAKDGRISASPSALLESLRRYADRTHIFCQAGLIHVPSKNRRLFSYLEKSVFEVTPADSNGVFHPKLWILRFQPTEREPDKDWPIVYRFLCPSRNITFDRSWDTMLALEGTLNPRGRKLKEMEPLCSFIARLPEYAVRPVPEAITSDVSRIAEELHRVTFELPQGFDEVRFWPLGIRDHAVWPFPEEMDYVMVISPFLADTPLRKLTKNAKGWCLVSRAESLEEISDSTRKRFNDVYTLNPAAEIDAEDDLASDEPVDIREGDETATSDAATESTQAAHGVLSGLHAKTYLADIGNRGSIWTGSANATDAAFSRNIEFLVELAGPYKQCGIDAIFDSDNHAFWNMLQPYVPPSEPAAPDESQARLERRLSEIQRRIARCPLKLSIVENGANVFDLALAATEPLFDDADTRIEVSCRPITLREHHLQSVPIRNPAVKFCEVSFEAITSFFVFQLKLALEDKWGECEFVVNVPMEGEPPDRRERLLLALLKDANHVLKYLLMLLADDGWDARKALDLLDGEPGGTHGPHQQSESGLPLLEPMLRALVKDPSKLDSVARIIADLSKTPEGRARIPAGFDEIWLPIRQVKESQK